MLFAVAMILLTLATLGVTAFTALLQSEALDDECVPDERLLASIGS
jgi:hypothetical protein